MIVSWKKWYAGVMLVLGLSAIEARADRMRPTIEYMTTGVIDGPYSGSPALTFQGVADGTMTSGSPFNLGAFSVTPASAGLSSYAGRFEITIQAISVDGAPLPANTPKAILRGHIDGSVGSGAPNNLNVYFGDATPFSGFPLEKATTLLQAGSISENISVNGPSLMALPTSATSVSVSGIGLPSPVPVPEPATLAFLLVGFSLVLRTVKRRRFPFSQ